MTHHREMRRKIIHLLKIGVTLKSFTARYFTARYFIGIFILFFASMALSADLSESIAEKTNVIDDKHATASPILESQTPEQIQSFIDKGKTKLPVAPEISAKESPHIEVPTIAPRVTDIQVAPTPLEPKTITPAPSLAMPETRVIPTVQETPAMQSIKPNAAPNYNMPNKLPIAPSTVATDTPKTNLEPQPAGNLPTSHVTPQAATPNIAPPIMPPVEPKSDLLLPDLSLFEDKEDKHITTDHAINQTSLKTKYRITIPLPQIITNLFPKRASEIKNNSPQDDTKVVVGTKAPTPNIAPANVKAPTPTPSPIPTMQQELTKPISPPTIVAHKDIEHVQAVDTSSHKAQVVEASPVIAPPKAMIVATVIDVASKNQQKPDIQKPEVQNTTPNITSHTAMQSPTEVKTIHEQMPVTEKTKPHINKKPVQNETNPEIETFVQNEMKMLTMPDDDVVLGFITNDAKFDYIGYSQYFAIYQKYREYVKRLHKLDETISFIDYHQKIDGNDIPALSDSELFATAVQDIQYSKIDDLRALVDNYKLLNLVDNNGNSLMHIATLTDNVAVTKWLIMRGANVNAINDDWVSPRDIAEYKQYWEILNLLESAHAK